MIEMPLGNNIDSAWIGSERVVFATSVDRLGKSNIITIGWVMRTNMDPPVLAIGLSKGSYSCANISRTGEFVLAIPGLDLAAAIRAPTSTNSKRQG
jgi:flavin reductase (DIM6/NTAB) family NADH-FMN oxidoreductase RutF